MSKTLCGSVISYSRDKERAIAMINRHGWVWLLGFTIATRATGAVAVPAEMFTPYIDQIRQSLPSDLEMRLPADITLGEAIPLEGEDLNQLVVKIFTTTLPTRLTVSLFTCESSPFPCLVGSFSVDHATSGNAQRELSRHRSMQTPITLASGVQGYYLEGTRQNPPSDFSSVMWEQNRMIYTVNFLSHERQNILNMAASMAHESPIRSR